MDDLTPRPDELKALNMVEVQMAKHTFDLALRKAMKEFEASTGLPIVAVETSMLLHRMSGGSLDTTVLGRVELSVEIPRTMGGPASLIV